MLTRRDKMFIGLITVAVLFCVSVSFGKAEKGGRSESRKQENMAGRAVEFRQAQNQNQSVQSKRSQAPNQTRSATRPNNSVSTLSREKTPEQIAPVSQPARTRTRVQDPVQQDSRPVAERRPTKRIANPEIYRPQKNTDLQVDNKVVVPKRAESPRKIEVVKPQPQIQQPQPAVEKKITPGEPADSIKEQPRNRQRPERAERIAPQKPTKEIIPEQPVRGEKAVSRPERNRDREENRTDRDFKQKGDTDSKALEPKRDTEPTKNIGPEQMVKDDKSVSRPERNRDREENRTDRDFKRRDDNNREAVEPKSNNSPAGNIERNQTEKSFTDKRSRSERNDGGHHGRSDFRRGDDRGISRPKIEKSHAAWGNRSNVNHGYSHGYNHGGNHEVHYRGRIWGHHPHRIYNRVIWPSYYYPIYYSCGPRVVYNYVRPYYHRKYVFVSIGGWWPSYYSSVRYSWYGYHPYNWYGCYPETYEVTGNTYNYYYYNTYTTEQVTATQAAPPLAGVDETTFADVRERLAQQAQQEPQTQTSADFLFEDAVSAFENGNYSAAVRALSEAIAVEPNDLVLPFAYAQALFADEQYNEAAGVIRTALVNLPPDQEGIFFPRGLYPKDEVLFEQIGRLEKFAGVFSVDADMNLLLAYQYIGIEKYDQAQEILRNSLMYEKNSEANAVLLRLIEKVKEQNNVSI